MAMTAAAREGRRDRNAQALAATPRATSLRAGLSSGAPIPNGSREYAGAGTSTQTATNASTTAAPSRPQAPSASAPVQARGSGVQPDMEGSVI
jgi:hypothetical protein